MESSGELSVRGRRAGDISRMRWIVGSGTAVIVAAPCDSGERKLSSWGRIPASLSAAAVTGPQLAPMLPSLFRLYI